MATQNSTLTQDQVKSLFDYKDGNLYKKINGKLSGSKHADGYLRSHINYKSHYNHRLIFLIHHGYMPKYIDHIDGNPANNCIENLRDVTNSQNQQNKKLNENNKSGFKNVHWSNSMKKWCVQITVDKKLQTVGFYDCLDVAGIAAKEARSQLHGEYANDGK
jgi:hypothetical protein